MSRSAQTFADFTTPPARTPSLDSHHGVMIWLFCVAAAVFAMAIIGAITRLTESGLSIVEWKPVTGALPPLNAADWEREFALYKTSPQYQQINEGMSLADFKYIYFWEWFHRLWGRLIGLVYAVPFFYFLLRKKFRAKMCRCCHLFYC